MIYSVLNQYFPITILISDEFAVSALNTVELVKYSHPWDQKALHMVATLYSITSQPLEEMAFHRDCTSDLPGSLGTTSNNLASPGVANKVESGEVS